LKYTGNYNLKKPEGSDTVNIDDLNDNFDVIDQALKNHEDDLATKETPAGAQAKANIAEANAKAYTDAHEQKAAPHSGHETPEGAQEKADAALNSAKQYTDQEVAEVSQALAAHKADYATGTIVVSGQYVGDGEFSQKIVHGIGYTPYLVIISYSKSNLLVSNGILMYNSNSGETVGISFSPEYIEIETPEWDNNVFYTLNFPDVQFNLGGRVYSWVAFCKLN